MTDVVVFVGPSCPADLLPRRTEVDFRAPARRGDIASASRRGAQSIVLLDGEMVHNYAPSPTEVLRAVESGVRVYGAASLGALRAVELRDFGVVGHGWVYEAFLRGEVCGDDELVCLMWPDTFAPLTVPLIRIRYALLRMVEQDQVSNAESRRVLRALKALHYEKRTPAAVVAAFGTAGLDECVAKNALSDDYDIKRTDSLECVLEALSDLSESCRAAARREE